MSPSSSTRHERTDDPSPPTHVSTQVRDKEEGNDDITFMERVESALADIMRALAL